LSANPGLLVDYFGRNRIKKNPLPVVAIPTTAGAGSEVTPYAVFTHRENRSIRKKIVADSSLFPKIVLADPELTLSLPASITADTGIDAFSHALESYLSNRSYPLSDTLASEAMKLLFNYLPKAMENPKEIDIRSQVLYASLLAGMAIAQTGTILVHAMSYRLTTDLGLSHGKACALLLPSVCEFNLKEGHPKLTLLGQCLGENMENMTTKKAAEKVLTSIKNFVHQLALLQGLKIEKIKEGTIEDFAQEIMQDKRKLASNPRQATLEDVIGMYKKALS
jgi:alcohol dehydrogenase class IV